MIRENKFIEYAENVEIIEEEEIIEEKVVDAGRSKRTRSNKVNEMKKVVRQTKKILQPTPNEKHTNSLMYLLQQTEGSIKLNTEFEYTTFQLDVPSKHLKSILDDFHLRFKDSPTFSDYLIREAFRLLKPDYFQKIKENSMMKLKMLLCHLVDDKRLKNYPSNPLLEVHSEEQMNQLRGELLNFHGTFYRPNRMKLILKSNMSIDKMERLLNESFGQLAVGTVREPPPPVGCSKGVPLDRLFAEKENQHLFYVKPQSKKEGIEDYLPIRQNLMVDLDEFEEHTLNLQLEDKLIEENGLGQTISNKISYDSNHLIFSYTSQKQSQCKNAEQLGDQLCFIYQVPYEKNQYPLMPLHFISSLICKEGPGTLVSHLRRHDLIIKMQAGNLTDCNFTNNSRWTLFFIKLHLTKRGIARLNEIVQALNAYLRMLNKLDACLASLYEEHAKLVCFDYNFKEVRSKSAHDLFVTVKKMHLYPTREIFVANRVPLFPKLAENLRVIRGQLKYLKLESCVMAVMTDESNFNNIDANFETYKGIDVKRVPVDRQVFAAVDLFRVNEFPRSNMFLRGGRLHNQVKLERKIYLVPERLNKDERKQLWYKKESTELLSLTNVNLLISNEHFKKSALYAAVCDLILVISEMQMQELFFQIREAGFLYRVEFNRFGLIIMVTGSDEIINVFRQILEKFASVACEEKLRKAKRIAMKSYEAALKNKFQTFLDLQNSLLFRNHYTIQQRMAELEKVTLNDLLKLMGLLFSEECKRVYLVQGNYTSSDAKQFFREIEKKFDLKPQVEITKVNTVRHNLTKDVRMEVDCSTSTEFSDDSTLDVDSTGDQSMDVVTPKRSINQTYNVTELRGKVDKPKTIVAQAGGPPPPKENEIFPINSYECYCLVKLVVDSPELIPNESECSLSDLSMECNTPEASFNHPRAANGQRQIESTSLKSAPNRRLFMDTNNCPSYNASRIGRSTVIGSSTSRVRNKSSSILSSVCTDVTNANYNLSPANNTNDSANYSRLIGKNSQIVGNLYFTHYSKEVQHSLLLRLLVELIKQHVNGFFRDEKNLRDHFFSADEFKNGGTPEVTFQEQVLIDGQIECVEFELSGDSKGFLFIVFDNYRMINSKSIDRLTESFLVKYMYEVVDRLDKNAFAGLTGPLVDELAKKPNWAQDMNRNWNEILIGKQRFDLREKMKATLEDEYLVRGSNQTIH